MTDELAKPKPRSRGSLRWIILIALGLLVWGVVEHRRADTQAQMLGVAEQRATTLEKQMASMQQQLTTATTKLNELARKNIPVAVVFRPAKTGSGMITYFKNNSSSPIDITVMLTNPGSGRRREANLTIQGNGVQEIGELQGWTFAPGDRVQITNAQFGTVEYVVSVNP